IPLKKCERRGGDPNANELHHRRHGSESVLSADKVAKSQLKDNSQGGPGLTAVDFRLTALAIGEDNWCLAKSGAAAAQQPEDFFVERIAAGADWIEGQLHEFWNSVTAIAATYVVGL